LSLLVLLLLVPLLLFLFLLLPGRFGFDVLGAQDVVEEATIGCLFRKRIVGEPLTVYEELQ
jgi:hypothetical protein